MASRLASLEHSIRRNGLLATLRLFYLYGQYKAFGRKQISFAGQQFRLRPGTTDFSVFREIYMDHEYDLQLERKDRLIVDLGANIGISPLYFSAFYPGSTIYAVEADAENFALLQANVAGKANIIPIHAAAWDKDEPVFIDDNSLHWGRKVSGQAARPNVQGITLGRLMQEQAISHIDILKVDIEGSEIQLFHYLGQHPELLQKISTIIIETHDWNTPGCSKAVFDCLAAVDYNVFITEDKFLIRLG